MGLSRAEWQGHGAMLLVSGLVGGSFSVGGQIAGEVDAAALNALRFAGAAVIVGLLVATTTGFQAQSFRAPWRFVVLGSIFGGYFILMFYGLEHASAISTSAVYTLIPMLTAGFGWLILRQVTTVRMAVALVVGALGAIIVIFRGEFDLLLSFQVGQGEAVFFIGCVVHAIYTPLMRKLNWGETAASFTFGVLIAGALALTAFGWGDIRSIDWTALGLKVWGSIAYLAVFASAVTFVLLQFAVLRLPSAKVMAYSYLVPSWVILWDLGFGIAPPSGIVILGPVLSGLALLMLLQNDDARLD
ncbi:EamA family transporter [Epibacterium sp. SM1969]|uniref:EamA family transporter n=1 Tax=Tritonibacter aquimaris TaxID=2663379 RepID=A0A844AW43_9RHOB|nr:DMT family transporter [Tritonibacter aquimaris]MQY42142.1 EamA family transporter [Tritonibacter aquimaris]